MDSAQTALAGEPIRWARVGILHLTLRFLGETTPAALNRVQEAAVARGGSWRPFDLQLRGLGCFPDSQRPRVVWAGAVDDSGMLALMAEDLEAIATEAGFPAEKRPFSAHLTVGRVKDRLSVEGIRRLDQVIRESLGESYGTVPVHAIGLLKSDLRPSGPVYTRIAAVDLGG